MQPHLGDVRLHRRQLDALVDRVWLLLDRAQVGLALWAVGQPLLDRLVWGRTASAGGARDAPCACAAAVPWEDWAWGCWRAARRNSRESSWAGRAAIAPAPRPGPSAEQFVRAGRYWCGGVGLRVELAGRDSPGLRALAEWDATDPCAGPSPRPGKPAPRGRCHPIRRWQQQAAIRGVSQW